MSITTAEAECLSQIETDFLPFHDIFRSLYGFNCSMPDQQQFDNTLALFQTLVNKHNFKIARGLENYISLNEAIGSIREAYENKQYEAISYGIWIIQ